MKKYIIGFLVGIIFSGSIVLATSISARDISYDSTHSVKDKIDDLYLHTDPLLRPVLLWTNPNPGSNFTPQTLTMDLSEYKYIIVVTKTTSSSDYLPRSSAIIPVLEEEPTDAPSAAVTGDRNIRRVVALPTEIKFGNGLYGTQREDSNLTIPYKIYGIKGELNIDIFE